MKKAKEKPHDVYVILHNIRSAYNVGSVLRTADAAGVARVYLTGYSALPLDRFGRVRRDVHKVALGAEETVPWKRCVSITKLFAKLKSEGIDIVGVEQGEDAQDYGEMRITKSTAFIFGNEVRGLSQRILRKCDTVLEIPMRGSKESLNVGVAAGIVLFRALQS